MIFLQSITELTTWAGGVEKIGIIGVLVLANVAQWYYTKTTIKKLQDDNDKLSDFILKQKL